MQSENALVLVSERKQELIETNKQIKESVFAEVEVLSSKTKEVGKVALIIGGTFLVAYFALNFFFSRKKKSISIPEVLDLTENQHKMVVVNEENNSFLNTPIVKKVLEAMAGFLIAIARQKLIDFLAELNQTKASDASVTEK